MFNIGGSALTSGPNGRALLDYAVAAASFADKLSRSTLVGAVPFAVAVDSKGREVSIPPDVAAAGPDAVADFLSEAIARGKLGDRVNIRADRFIAADGYEYDVPDDAGDHYTETVTPGAPP